MSCTMRPFSMTSAAAASLQNASRELASSAGSPRATRIRAAAAAHLKGWSGFDLPVALSTWLRLRLGSGKRLFAHNMEQADRQNTVQESEPVCTHHGASRSTKYSSCLRRTNYGIRQDDATPAEHPWCGSIRRRRCRAEGMKGRVFLIRYSEYVDE